MRFGRLAVPVINDNPDYKFEIGKGVVVREGKDVTIVATGIMVNSALEAAEKLAEEGIEAEVLNIHTIKPLDEELVVASAKKTGKVVTAEEHSVIGGLGSAVCDCLCAKYPTPVYKIGMQDVFGESGSAADLMVKYEIDGAGVIRTFWSVMLPNARGVITTVALFAFVWQWNDVYYTTMFAVNSSDFPLLTMQIINTAEWLGNLLLRSELRYLVSADVRGSSMFTSLIANTEAFLMMLPLLIAYLFVQKLFVEGIERTGIVG